MITLCVRIEERHLTTKNGLNSLNGGIKKGWKRFALFQIEDVVHVLQR